VGTSTCTDSLIFEQEITVQSQFLCLVISTQQIALKIPSLPRG
jgi:hypothetical protein